MPRPSWSGFLKLSLVSCPVYLSPATSEAERIKLNMINPATGNRINMVTVDAETREPVERSETVKGYQIEKGQYVTLTDDELRELAVESTKTINLSAFIDRAKVDPLFIAEPYFVYPDKNGEEAYRVIAQALASKKRVALGRLVLSSREHPVMVEPFGGGLLMSKLRAPDEVRAADFDFTGAVDKQMVELAQSIMDKLEGEWEPNQFQDRYQEALRGLIEAKQQGMPLPKGAAAPSASNVVDLMTVLKRSLAESAKAPSSGRSAPKKAKGDQRQRSMLLPVKGGSAGSAPASATARPETSKVTRRKKAG